MRNYRTTKNEYPLPTTVEKNFSSVPTLSDVTIYESGWETNTPKKGFGPYVRDYYLLHFVLEGKGTYTIGDKTFTVHKNQVFLIPPKRSTTYVADEAEPWTYFWIGFNSVQCKALMEACGFSENNYVLPFADTNWVKRQIRKLYSLKAYPIAYDYSIHGCLYELLGDILYASQKNHLSIKNNAYVFNAKSFIETHFTENISVGDIAKHVGLNRSYFSRIFKTATDVTPQEYLMDTRLTHALLLLSQTKLPLGEISLKCAFNDYSHFYKAFAKKYGLSPGAYRTYAQRER